MPTLNMSTNDDLPDGMPEIFYRQISERTARNLSRAAGDLGHRWRWAVMQLPPNSLRLTDRQLTDAQTAINTYAYIASGRRFPGDTYTHFTTLTSLRNTLRAHRALTMIPAVAALMNTLNYVCRYEGSSSSRSYGHYGSLRSAASLLYETLTSDSAWSDSLWTSPYHDRRNPEQIGRVRALAANLRAAMFHHGVNMTSRGVSVSRNSATDWLTSVLNDYPATGSPVPEAVALATEVATQFGVEFAIPASAPGNDTATALREQLRLANARARQAASTRARARPNAAYVGVQSAYMVNDA